MTADAGPWEVRIEASFDEVHVGAVRRGSPNWFNSDYVKGERKVRRLIARCQRWCDEKNAAEAAAVALVARIAKEHNDP